MGQIWWSASHTVVKPAAQQRKTKFIPLSIFLHGAFFLKLDMIWRFYFFFFKFKPQLEEHVEKDAREVKVKFLPNGPPKSRPSMIRSTMQSMLCW